MYLRTYVWRSRNDGAKSGETIGRAVHGTVSGISPTGQRDTVRYRKVGDGAVEPEGWAGCGCGWVEGSSKYLRLNSVAPLLRTGHFEVRRRAILHYARWITIAVENGS